jgi:hypothetical protein
VELNYVGCVGYATDEFVAEALWVFDFEWAGVFDAEAD